MCLHYLFLIDVSDKMAETTTASQDDGNPINKQNDESKTGENEPSKETSHVDDHLYGRDHKRTNMIDSRLQVNSNKTSSPSGVGSSYIKEVISSLHRATMASAMSGLAIRDAALLSLVNIVESENTEKPFRDISSHSNSATSCQYSLIVLQVC